MKKHEEEKFMFKRKGLFALLVILIAGLCTSGLALAGPGTVQVQTIGDITIRMGAQIRLVPTSEINRDFGVSDRLGDTDAQKAAAKAIWALGSGILVKTSSGTFVGAGSESTRAHLNESGGAVKDGYIRGENRLFFNFAHGQDWDVYMALESDTVLDRKSADRTDWGYGHQSQQFGIERLLASFNLPWINSRLEAGWDARGIDIGYGGIVYGDDDPGIGIKGSAKGFKWQLWYIKKDEDEAGYWDDEYDDTLYGNPIAGPDQGGDVDRTFYYGILGRTFGVAYLETFLMLDRNYTKSRDIDRYFLGLQGKATLGIFKPSFEIVYCTGDYDSTSGTDYDINSFAMFADIAMDLHKVVGIKRFEAHIGGIYAKGDNTPDNGHLSGFAPATGIARFTPSFGTEQSISFDGNQLLGQTLYSILPAYYGTIRGAGINGGAALNNPGFIMVGGGVKAGYGRWSYKTNVMAMWYDQTEAVEAYFAWLGQSNTKIDHFMGVEWNNELAYKLYDSVTLKAGAAFFFPGSGARDITKAVDAIGQAGASSGDIAASDFNDGRSSDDVSMRIAAELLWFF